MNIKDKFLFDSVILVYVIGKVGMMGRLDPSDQRRKVDRKKNYDRETTFSNFRQNYAAVASINPEVSCLSSNQG